MSFSKGKNSICLTDITNKITEADIIAYYLNIKEIPCIINSPLRKDNRPSFGLFSPDGVKVYYKDLSTKDKGGVYDLLGKLWNCSFKDVLVKISKDLSKFDKNINIQSHKSCIIRSEGTHNINTEVKCKVREWEDYDIEYWKSYGINIEWLKYAEVYPISHKIIIKNGNKYVFKTDKYAYAYVEHKEGKVTLKIYQPFNKNGYKWCNKHDSSTISLWTKVPEYGEQICICSSLKDALCLWSNTNIPAIAIQGEGYSISNTAIKELKRRYKHLFICLDNDKPGIEDAKKLSEETGFVNIVLPSFNGGKDISDLFRIKGKEEFKRIILPLFSYRQEKEFKSNNYTDDLPFEV